MRFVVKKGGKRLYRAPTFKHLGYKITVNMIIIKLFGVKLFAFNQRLPARIHLNKRLILGQYIKYLSCGINREIFVFNNAPFPVPYARTIRKNNIFYTVYIALLFRHFIQCSACQQYCAYPFIRKHFNRFDIFLYTIILLN